MRVDLGAGSAGLYRVATFVRLVLAALVAAALAAASRALRGFDDVLAELKKRRR